MKLLATQQSNLQSFERSVTVAFLNHQLGQLESEHALSRERFLLSPKAAPRDVQTLFPESDKVLVSSAAYHRGLRIYAGDVVVYREEDDIFVAVARGHVETAEDPTFFCFVNVCRHIRENRWARTPEVAIIPLACIVDTCIWTQVGDDTLEVIRVQ